MGLSWATHSTLIYTSELILCFTICILRLICQAIAYKYTAWQRNKLLTSQGIFHHPQQHIDNNFSPDTGMFAPFALFIKKPHSWFINHEFRHNIVKVAVDPDPQITLTMLWQNSLSITGQTHEKLTSINFVFYDNKLSNCSLSLVPVSHKLYIHVSVRLLTIKICQWAQEFVLLS